MKLRNWITRKASVREAILLYSLTALGYAILYQVTQWTFFLVLSLMGLALAVLSYRLRNVWDELD